MFSTKVEAVVVVGVLLQLKSNLFHTWWFKFDVQLKRSLKGGRWDASKLEHWRG